MSMPIEMIIFLVYFGIILNMTEFAYLAQYGLEFVIFLLLYPEGWNHSVDIYIFFTVYIYLYKM